MTHANSAIERHYQIAAGELQIDGVGVTSLAEKYGTPLFIYSAKAIDDQWNRLRAALPREFSICYSVKANPNQAILRHFLSKGAGLEIASGGEFLQATAAGCAPENILFAGPGKGDEELEFVLSKGIGEIHAESANEVHRIARICKKLNLTARLAVRVNPSAEAEGGAMRMGGRAAAFGIDEEKLDEVIDLILSIPQLEFSGIHLFTGTQILDANILITQYRKGLEIALRVTRRIKKPLHTLDFGGGLGIPYFTHEHSLDTDALYTGLEKLMQETGRDPALKNTRFLVEPGRFLVGEAGIYLTRILDIKVSREKKFLIVDGGMHHQLAASGNLGQTIKRNYPVAVVNRLGNAANPANAPAEKVEVVGPLCTPLDVLARDVELPHAEIGDLVAVFQSGAYARAASPLGFLSHPAPPEVWVDHGHSQLVRRRGTYDDYLRDQLPAEAPRTPDHASDAEPELAAKSGGKSRHK
jgi:diaminopimelate decarboxylase